MGLIRITYEFRFPDAPARSYAMDFDSESMRMQPRQEKAPAEWARLGFQQCRHCPLRSATSPHCPIARNIEDVVEHFKMEVSHSRATVLVYTAERTFSHETDLQNGLQGLLGLIMATSGCPHMDFLKAVARFHLPFATFEETVVRVMSIYLLQQYFRAKKGEAADYAMVELRDRYERISQVNQGIIRRLRSLGGRDADKNALIILDSFASLLPSTLNTEFGNMIPAIIRGEVEAGG